MLEHAWLIPSIPALSFFLILFFGKRLPRKGSEIGILAVGTSLVLSIVATVQWIDRVTGAEGHAQGLRAFGRGLVAQGEHGTVVKPVIETVTWWRNGSVEFTVGTHVDGLTVMMMLVVTIVSFLVHVYSTAYMRGDRRYTHYFAMLSLFTASMLTLVVASNTLMMLVGWELVGLCSFVLIGHWWEEKENSDAALKAFLTTRTGDIGLMIGIIILFFAAGSFDILKVNRTALAGGNHALMLAAAVALLVGIIGKSGQFPLHTWLPDAMAGPTPVSALIHAATMVVAGVFLGARLYPVFFEGFSIANGGVNLMAAVGGTTVIIGAALAFVQRDIKKVLAYSTISQLGYMVMALGVGAWTAAMFHLFTHAFFKAGLFLGAGSVSHSGSHHSFDMKDEMGGLRKYMPQTFTTFVIGSAALAGIFPLAGFWSKDEILTVGGKNGYEFFVAIGLIGAVLTASYMTRCIYLTFFGEYRGHGHPHESERTITVPLWILASLSIVAGFVNVNFLGIHFERFAEWVDPSVAFPELGHFSFSYVNLLISTLVVFGSVAITAKLYFSTPELGWFHGLTQRNKAAHLGYEFLDNKYYLDHLYTDVIVGGIKGPIARGAYWFDQHVIDAIVNGVGKGTRRAGELTYDVIDQRVVDRGYDDLAAVTGDAGGLLRLLQSGRVQRYALLLFAGVGMFSLAIFLYNVV